MTTFDELNELSSRELHDRAVDRAKRHVDVGFFFDLLEALPAAEAATGNMDRAQVDIFKVSGLVMDLFNADEGELADQLRPFYIEYLSKHED